jgi:hypothetical protein
MSSTGAACGGHRRPSLGDVHGTGAGRACPAGDGGRPGPAHPDSASLRVPIMSSALVTTGLASTARSCPGGGTGRCAYGRHPPTTRRPACCEARPRCGDARFGGHVELQFGVRQVPARHQASVPEPDHRHIYLTPTHRAPAHLSRGPILRHEIAHIHVYVTGQADRVPTRPAHTNATCGHDANSEV